MAYVHGVPRMIPYIFSCNLNKLCLIAVFFALALLRDCAIKSWFIFPPHLNSLSALPGQKSHIFNWMPCQHFITSAEEGGYVFSSVCLSVCPSDYSQTCERILTKFFGGVGHGSRTKWYNFGGDPDHASDPGVQSPKSGSSGSAEVCGLWAYL